MKSRIRKRGVSNISSFQIPRWHDGRFSRHFDLNGRSPRLPPMLELIPLVSQRSLLGQVDFLIATLRFARENDFLRINADGVSIYANLYRV